MTLITAKEAAEAALRHGLSLPDAAALGRLAESPEEADTIAEMFSKPRQLTGADLQKMTPAEIVKAKEEGRFTDLLGEKSS